MSEDLGLTQAGKEELALALLLWKDFKADGKFAPDLILQMYKFAAILGIEQEVKDLVPKLPPMKVVQRYP